MESLSPRNPRVQAVRRLARQARERADRQAFVVEGPKLLDDAIASGCAGGGLRASRTSHDLMPVRYDGIRCVEVSESALASMATTVTPQPVIAVVPMPEAPRVADLASTGHVFVLDGVGDPGNAGTILRSAEASGAAGVIFTTGSVDPFAPKVVRSSAGSIFRVPVVPASTSARPSPSSPKAGVR